MAVYVDDLMEYDLKGQWCHMIADDLTELHAFAARLGLLRCWFQNHPRHPHYDLRPSKRALAVKLGAVELSPAALAKKAHETYDRPVR